MCRSQVLPTIVATGANDSASTRSATSSSARTPRRRVMPNAAICARGGGSASSARNSSASFGFDSGKPGLDEREAHAIDQVGEPNLLADRQRDALALRAVAERRVVDADVEHHTKVYGADELEHPELAIGLTFDSRRAPARNRTCPPHAAMRGCRARRRARSASTPSVSNAQAVSARVAAVAMPRPRALAGDPVADATAGSRAGACRRAEQHVVLVDDRELHPFARDRGLERVRDEAPRVRVVVRLGDVRQPADDLGIAALLARSAGTSASLHGRSTHPSAYDPHVNG